MPRRANIYLQAPPSDAASVAAFPPSYSPPHSQASLPPYSSTTTLPPPYSPPVGPLTGSQVQQPQYQYQPQVFRQGYRQPQVSQIPILRPVAYGNPLIIEQYLLLEPILPIEAYPQPPISIPLTTPQQIVPLQLPQPNYPLETTQQVFFLGIQTETQPSPGQETLVSNSGVVPPIVNKLPTIAEEEESDEENGGPLRLRVSGWPGFFRRR